MRILIADPTPFAESLEFVLKSVNFAVYTVSEGSEAIDCGKIYDYDLITLSMGLPDMPGMDVIRSLRASRCDTPILVIDDGANAVQALSLGADDYVHPEVARDELVARIHAIIRRSKGRAQNTAVVGDLVVNLTSRTISVAGQPVALTGKEFSMLELMALRLGACISKEQFLSHLYGGMDEPEVKIIDVFICKLRKKLRAAGSECIETVWGRGYVLRDPATPTVGSPSLAPELADLGTFGPTCFRASEAAPGELERIVSPPLAPYL